MRVIIIPTHSKLKKKYQTPDITAEMWSGLLALTSCVSVCVKFFIFFIFLKYSISFLFCFRCVFKRPVKKKNKHKTREKKSNAPRERERERKKRERIIISYHPAQRFINFLLLVLNCFFKFLFFSIIDKIIPRLLFLLISFSVSIEVGAYSLGMTSHAHSVGFSLNGSLNPKPV